MAPFPRWQHSLVGRKRTHPRGAAIRLLGAQVMLTGIRHEVAQTLVGLGVDLSMIVTHSSLQSGIALKMQSVRSRSKYHG
jgi:hypothetical protein